MLQLNDGLKLKGTMITVKSPLEVSKFCHNSQGVDWSFCMTGDET